MRFGYDTLFDSVRLRNALPTAIVFRESYDDTVVSTRISNNRLTSLFAYSDFHRFGRGGSLPVLTTSSQESQGRDENRPDDRMNQSRSAPCTPDTVGKKRKARQPVLPSRGQFFVGGFDHFSPEELEKLDEIYEQKAGKNLSKREVKMFSDMTRIAQCKIRRWYDAKMEKVKLEQENNSEELSSDSVMNGIDHPASDLGPLLVELEANVEQLQGINKQIEDLLLLMTDTIKNN